MSSAAASSDSRASGIRAPATKSGGIRQALRRVALAASCCLVLFAGYLAGGFVRFAQDIIAFSRPVMVAKADGIVVLTGGALRLDQAIDLLKDGIAERLLISGVNPGTSVATLSRLTSTDRSWFDCCVDIDYAALNTVGNAEMTDRWAAMRGFDELILVTSDYHMPRSLLEFDRLSGVRSIVPYAVRRSDLWSLEHLPNAAGLKVLFTEYAKLLAARFRVATGIAPQDLVGSRMAELVSNY